MLLDFFDLANTLHSKGHKKMARRTRTIFDNNVAVLEDAQIVSKVGDSQYFFTPHHMAAKPHFTPGTPAPTSGQYQTY